MKNKIAIVVVLYNDMPKRYIFNNDGYNIIIVDNTPDRDLSLTGNNLYYFPLKENHGIARALNIGFKKAKELGAKWVLTMDQDSDLPSNMIDEYIRFINRGFSNIGIISPLINMYHGEDKSTSDSFAEINEALTSGSFVNMQAYDATGGFEDKLFIDCVDFEFCWNLKSKGYKVYQLNSVLMQHQLGDTHEIKIFRHHVSYVTHHNYIRRYYMTRNSLYVRSLYAEIMPKRNDVLRHFIAYIKIILFEHDVSRKIKAIKLGKRDFRDNKFGKFDYNL